MKSRSLITITLATLCFSLQAQGAPNIKGVSGNVATGEPITINGNDFGSRSDAPIFFDVVDTAWVNGNERHQYAGQSNGNSVPSGADKLYRSNVYGFFSLFQKADNNVRDFSYYHATIKKNRWGDAHDAWLSTPTAVPSPKSGKVRRLYVTWLLRLSFGSLDQFGAHKFIRLWDTIKGKDDNVRISWSQQLLGYNGGGPDWGDTRVRSNEWTRLELLVDADRGTIEAWLNGQKIHNVVDFSPNGSTGLQPRLIGWDASGDVDYLGETVDLARLYIDSSAARVELCDKPTWRQCSTREIQMISSWDDSEITAKLTPGRLEELQGKYLYVVNSRGQVNSKGFQLCADCPERPESPERRIIRRQLEQGR